MNLPQPTQPIDVDGVQPNRSLVFWPDSGCNFEINCDQCCLELESLGPLCKLVPGETVEHKEEWIILPEINSYENLDHILNVPAI